MSVLAISLHMFAAKSSF